MAQVVARQGRKAQCKNAALLDQFSNLPDPIIHHIFSFLEMDDIARTGVASKRFRQLFISSPFLKFKSICSYDGPPNMCKQFSDFVDRLLSHRNGLEIRRFCLHWSCHHKDNCDIDLNLIDKWINVALNCQAQEIDLEVGVGQEDPIYESGEIPVSDSEENIDQESDLEVGIGEEGPLSESDEVPLSDSEVNTGLDYQSLDPFFELPRCMFSSKTLRILKLDLQYKRLKEPAAVFGFLEDLSLHFMVGSDSEKALRKLISASCPLLKRLTLASIEDIKTLKISHPCLEELSLFDLPYNLCRIDISAKKLQKLSLDLNSLFPGHMCTMRINAPNLQDLKWTALTANNVYLSQFKFLKSASLSVSGISNDYVEKATIRNRLTALLQGVCCSRVLHINSDVLETQFLHNRLPNGFDNLQQLVITVDGCLKDYHFPVLASILTRSPDLESLSITCSENRYQPGYSRKLKYKATKFCKQHEGFNNLRGHQLQEMEIELKGKGHQVGVVENMLKIAKGLKKMTIICSKANLKSLSKIGLHDSRAASLSFKLNLVEKEFHIEELRRIDYRRKLNLMKQLYHDPGFF